MLSMTRGERRGIIAVLAVLAVIVAIQAMRRCGSDTVVTDNSVAAGVMARDSLMALPDTSSVTKKKYRRRNAKKKVAAVRKSIPERSPLDEVL